MYELLVDYFERDRFSFEMLNSLLKCSTGCDHTSASYLVFFKNLFRVIQGTFAGVRGLYEISFLFSKDEKA